MVDFADGKVSSIRLNRLGARIAPAGLPFNLHSRIVALLAARIILHFLREFFFPFLIVFRPICRVRRLNENTVQSVRSVQKNITLIRLDRLRSVFDPLGFDCFGFDFLRGGCRSECERRGSGHDCTNVHGSNTSVTGLGPEATLACIKSAAARSCSFSLDSPSSKLNSVHRPFSRP